MFDYIVCVPVKEAFNIPGSKQHECAECKTKVMMAPSSQKYLENNQATVVCYRCLLPKAKAGDVDAFGILPGAIKEIQKLEAEQN